MENNIALQIKIPTAMKTSYQDERAKTPEEKKLEKARGLTAFEYFMKEKADACQLFLHARPNRTIFHFICFEGATPVVKGLVNNFNIAERDADGWTGIHFAAANRHSSVLPFLIKNLNNFIPQYHDEMQLIASAKYGFPFIPTTKEGWQISHIARFDASKTQKILSRLGIICPKLSSELLNIYFSYFISSGFLHPIPITDSFQQFQLE